MGEEVFENSPTEKDWEMLVDENMDMTHQCALKVQKASCVLGCIKTNMATREMEVIFCSYLLNKLYSTLQISNMYIYYFSSVF